MIFDKQWRVQRQLRKLLAAQPKPTMAFVAQPLTMNPAKEHKLLRAVSRLKRILYALEQGDTRQSLLDEIEKQALIIRDKKLVVPSTGAEAELLVLQIKG